MKVQEVILRAMAKRITWWQAAEILGISDRSMRRWKRRYEEWGYDGLFDRRRGKPSPKRVPLEQVDPVLRFLKDPLPIAGNWIDAVLLDVVPRILAAIEEIQLAHSTASVVPRSILCLSASGLYATYRCGRDWEGAARRP